MKRDKYPERVPFRLTRMLVNAMEVSGIEGSFRSSCENVLGVQIFLCVFPNLLFLHVPSFCRCCERTAIA